MARNATMIAPMAGKRGPRGSTYELDGGKLRAAREAARLTATEFAARCGITKHYVRYLETSQRRPGLALVSRIEEVLGIEAEEFGIKGLPPRRRPPAPPDRSAA